MILIILLSFVLTGGVSYVHYKKENEQYHRERLKRKEQSVRDAIHYYFRQENVTGPNDSLVQLFSDKICELADINAMDVNIFSLDGELLISSDPELHDNHIIPRRIPRALLRQVEKKQHGQVLVQRQTDSLSFLSTYSMLRSPQNRPVAVINLPYFDAEDYHNDDLKAFLWSLAQIYSILFLTAVLLAYLLSNYITSSLQEVGQKIKNLQITGKNPRIDWPYRDEIGTLVAAYNRMLQALEENVEKMARQEREDAWKKMARQVAHEIKNPLTPMRLNVQYLQQNLATEQPGKLREFSESMLEQIDILSHIAGTFSRFAALPEKNLQPVEVLQTARKVVSLYPGRNIKLHHPAGEVHWITADSDQLSRALTNLINNALEATPPGELEQVELGIKSDRETVWLWVTDHGVGISAAQQARIFEPAFTTKSSGMGLGLALVKTTVEGFGGRITVISREGEGSTFTIQLPRIKEGFLDPNEEGRVGV